MKKFAMTTALALVLAGSAYAQGHNHGGGGAGGGHAGGGGGAAFNSGQHAGGGGGGVVFNGGAHVGSGGGQSMMSRGPSGPSSFGYSGRIGSSHNGASTVRESQFGRMDHGPQDRTVYNQERGNRSLYNSYNDQDRGHENLGRDRDNQRFGTDRGRDTDFRHRGIVRGNFFEHGRHFGFRRFWHNEWVFLTDWDSCTAFAWVHVAPDVWAWRPIDVCVG